MFATTTLIPENNKEETVSNLLRFLLHNPDWSNVSFRSITTLPKYCIIFVVRKEMETFINVLDANINDINYIDDVIYENSNEYLYCKDINKLRIFLNYKGIYPVEK